MPKYDISQNPSAADRLLERLENPRHRHIVENYRRHALLEVSGQWEGIFTPDMTIEVPRYRAEMPGSYRNSSGSLVGQEVKDFYEWMRAGGNHVIVVQDEIILVHDAGFAHEFNGVQFLNAPTLRANGMDADGDEDNWYAVTTFGIGFWPFDERARLIGEHISSIGAPTIEPVEYADVITPQMSFEILNPLIRPLPEFVPEMV